MNEMQECKWLLLLASLSGRSASTPRVRLWRALKELGAATLRDGTSLLPASGVHRQKLEDICVQVENEGGSTWLLDLPIQSPETEIEMSSLFDRSDAYYTIQQELETFHTELAVIDEPNARRRLRQLEHDFDAIRLIDFFPGETLEQTSEAIKMLVNKINHQFSPNEPLMASGQIKQLDLNLYQQRLWATRKNLWVDRIASAWLIRRFIDKKAQFLWLDNTKSCPSDALGFDFDGAPFTHVDDKVTFEVLQTSFTLDKDPALLKFANLIHYLDVGGLPQPEAVGLEAVLAGLRETTVDDDEFLNAATPMLDALYQYYSTSLLNHINVNNSNI